MISPIPEKHSVKLGFQEQVGKKESKLDGYRSIEQMINYQSEILFKVKELIRSLNNNERLDRIE